MNAPTFVAIAALVLSFAHAGPARATPAAPRAPMTTHRASADELVAIVREAIASSGAKLPRGATLTRVRSATSVDLPNSSTRVTIEVTPPPRRAGAVVVPAVLSFWKDENVTARVPVTIELSIPADALVRDVSKGSPLVVVVRRGLVEVSAPAVSAADGDIGEVIQVLLRPSGRALRAKLVAKDRAVAVDEATS